MFSKNTYDFFRKKYVRLFSGTNPDIDQALTDCPFSSLLPLREKMMNKLVCIRPNLSYRIVLLSFTKR